jgi:hypothetical protein
VHVVSEKYQRRYSKGWSDPAYIRPHVFLMRYHVTSNSFHWHFYMMGFQHFAKIYNILNKYSM